MTSLLTHSSNNSYSSCTHMQHLFSHAMDTEVYISHSTIACKQYLLFPCFPYFLKLSRALSVLTKYTQFSFCVCPTQCLPDPSGLHFFFEHCNQVYTLNPVQTLCSDH